MAAALLMGLAAGCRQEQQAVKGVAESAMSAEQKAQAAAKAAQASAQAAGVEQDRQRTALEAIPLPTKSLYVDVHDANSWVNPFLSVGAETMSLRIIQADANPSSMGQGTMLRPAAARRQEVQIRPGDLPGALIALPPGAWHYGRVIAVAENPQAGPKERPQIRRNLEAAIQKLTDLGVVVEEWPSR